MALPPLDVIFAPKTALVAVMDETVGDVNVGAEAIWDEVIERLSIAILGLEPEVPPTPLL